jgi:hypothetical protein
MMGTQADYDRFQQSFLMYYIILVGTRGSVVGRGTMLPAWR